MLSDSLLSAFLLTGLLSAGTGFLVGQVHGFRLGKEHDARERRALQRAEDFIGAPVAPPKPRLDIGG